MHEIISRAEALARGLKRFFTGEPCKYGHVLERQVRNGTCIGCQRQSNRKYQQKNPEKVAMWQRNKRAKEPEKERQSQRRHREKYRERYLEKNKKRYWANRERFLAEAAERQRKRIAAFKALKELGIEV